MQRIIIFGEERRATCRLVPVEGGEVTDRILLDAETPVPHRDPDPAGRGIAFIDITAASRRVRPG